MTPMALLLPFLGLLSFQQVQASREAYFTLDEAKLGRRDYRVANGNPMKGLIANPEFWYDPNIENIDSSMDIYYIPVGKIMRDDPSVLGPELAFDWTYVENRLSDSGKKNRHAVLTFAVHYPGEPLSLPGHLQRSNEVPLHWYDEFMGGGLTPDYGNDALLNALTEFVVALGKKYDGDPRIAFIHLGLLGFWGEWHTFPLLGLVPKRAKTKIVDTFRESFKVTKLQARYPDSELDGFGYYDGSFAFNTLDGDANGGVINKDWYFWPMVQKYNQSSFWRTAPMGGEVRPEIQHLIFEDSYPRRTFEHQDFEESVAVTHATYMLHPNAFIEGGYSGTELRNAVRGHCFLGYNFILNKLAVIEANAGSGLVDVEITIEQIGVAPFYYPLSVKLDCPDLPSARQFGGLEGLVDKGSFATRKFRGIPATALCLDAITLSLDSPMLLPGRQMKFSQGDGAVVVSLPLPNGQVPTNPSEVDGTLEEPVEPIAAQPEESIVVDPSTRPAQSEEGNTIDEAVHVDFFYLASRFHGVDQWASLADGDVVEAPEFGLSLEARPSQAISSIWFTYDLTGLKIENVPPYSLRSNSYLSSAGVKRVVATVFKNGRSVAATALSFEVTAPNGNSLGLSPRLEKQTLRASDDSLTKHEFKPVNYTAHGFNTPFAPSLLQLVALEESVNVSDEETLEMNDVGGIAEELPASAGTGRLTHATGLLLLCSPVALIAWLL